MFALTSNLERQPEYVHQHTQILSASVGWVERSETTHLLIFLANSLNSTALHPSYLLLIELLIQPHRQALVLENHYFLTSNRIKVRLCFANPNYVDTCIILL